MAGRGGGSPSAAAAPAPFAARAISKTRSGPAALLPAGLFDCSRRRVGRFDDDPEARTFYTAELNVSPGSCGRQLITRTTCSSKPTRPLMWAADCPDPHRSQRPQSMSGATAIQVQERPRRPANPHRGEGIQVHRHIASARPSARLHQYGRGGHDPLPLLRDAVLLRSSIDSVQCRPAGQLLC